MDKPDNHLLELVKSARDQCIEIRDRTQNLIKEIKKDNEINQIKTLLRMLRKIDRNTDHHTLSLLEDYLKEIKYIDIDLLNKMNEFRLNLITLGQSSTVSDLGFVNSDQVRNIVKKMINNIQDKEQVTTGYYELWLYCWTCRQSYPNLNKQYPLRKAYNCLLDVCKSDNRFFTTSCYDTTKEDLVSSKECPILRQLFMDLHYFRNIDVMSWYIDAIVDLFPNSLLEYVYLHQGMIENAEHICKINDKGFDNLLMNLMLNTVKEAPLLGLLTMWIQNGCPERKREPVPDAFADPCTNLN